MRPIATVSVCVAHESAMSSQSSTTTAAAAGGKPGGGMTSATGQPPSGWSVETKKGPGGTELTHFITRAGTRVQTMNEVHYHLKVRPLCIAKPGPPPRNFSLSPTLPTPQNLPASEINEDEALWLRTLERYGQNCRHWAIARSAHDLPECPTFRPTADEFVEPGRYFQKILPQVRGHAATNAPPTRRTCCCCMQNTRTTHPTNLPSNAPPASPQIESYGMCKVVPPPGWAPQPWSGRPPKGFNARTPVAGAGGVATSSSVPVVQAIAAGVKQLTPSADVGDPRLAPRVQPLQLFNKGFEQCDKDGMRLTIEEYHALCEATWPQGDVSDVENAERAFWELMASRPPKVGLHTLPTGLEAAKLRMEAQHYQECVQARQQPPPSNNEGTSDVTANGLKACILPSLPWELQQVPPFLCRPAPDPPPPPPPKEESPPRPPKVGAGAASTPPSIAAAIAAATNGDGGGTSQPPAQSAPAAAEQPPAQQEEEEEEKAPAADAAAPTAPADDAMPTGEPPADPPPTDPPPSPPHDADLMDTGEDGAAEQPPPQQQPNGNGVEPAPIANGNGAAPAAPAPAPPPAAAPAPPPASAPAPAAEASNANGSSTAPLTSNGGWVVVCGLTSRTISMASSAASSHSTPRAAATTCSS